jgi:hypothetical protein
MSEAEAVLNKFMPRAFRRPLRAEELQRYLGLVQATAAAGRSLGEGLRVALTAVLCSPNFLYLDETTATSAKSPSAMIDDYQLATRLSYFLWGSMPDNELFALAAAKTLSDKKSLHAQVERLLADPRSQRFVTNFVGQWLGLRAINETTPDSKLYGSYDELLQMSLIQESEQFFQHLLTHNISIMNCIDSDFTMMNGRVAQHYKINDVEGLATRKVSLPADSVRGGVMTQGAVLKITANGTTTSPVKRGVWVLENIIGQTPRPPPPNIAGIEPDIRGAETIRQQLDKHRDVESCNACHRSIDPPGFALEAFDPIGQHRDKYLRFIVNPQHADKGWGSVQKGSDVDPSGQMASGQAFAHIREFKQLLLAQPHLFTKCLSEKFLIYSLGRELGYSDRPLLEKIALQVAAQGHGLRTLIHAVVQSEAFRNK